MTIQKSSLATPIAHLVGPGKLKIHNGRLAFSTGQGSPTKLDPAALDTVLCYGNVGISDDAVRVLFQHDVDVSWLSPRGSRLRGRFSRLDQRGASLRAQQYRAANDHRICLELARVFVCQKIESQLLAAKHYQRHGNEVARALVRKHGERFRAASQADTLDRLRGLEGDATRAWFAVFAALLRSPWQFPGRVRRPPTDPVNALMSLGYTWLLNRVMTRLQAAGLELYFGSLHDYRAGRPSLACDLIEPLRVPLVDRWVIQMCNEGRVQPGEFVAVQGHGMRLHPESFGTVLGFWEEHWQARDARRKVEDQVRDFIERLRKLTSAPTNPLVPG